MDALKVVGQFVIEVVRDGEVIRRIKTRNTVVTAGLNSLLDVGFRNQSQITAWYCGLIADGSYSGIAASDTMASHPGWTEFTGYSDNRKAWSPGAAASGEITNGTAMSFAITGGDTLKGIFITSAATKGGSTGTLWSAKLFDSDQAVINGDTIRVTYTLALSNAT